jgi:hypothetical protein
MTEQERKKLEETGLSEREIESFEDEFGTIEEAERCQQRWKAEAPWVRAMVRNRKRAPSSSETTSQKETGQ